MRSGHGNAALLLLRLLSPLLLIAASMGGAVAVGVNWGRRSSHPLPPATVVQWLLQGNNVPSVRLADADPGALASLSGTGIGVTVGIPNEMLRAINASKAAAAAWVHDNVTRYLTAAGGVRIEYVAVGDEPFQLSYEQVFEPFVLSAATNIQQALNSAKLPNKVKVVVPCSSDAFLSDSGLPSKGHFRPGLNKTMIELLSFLTKSGSPFVIDINPFMSLQQNKNLSLDYITFQTKSHPVKDGPNNYDNYFDATIDTLVSSLANIGYGDIDIVVGKIGWPTDGAVNATPAIAQTFLHGLIGHLQNKVGTPLRPKRLPIETYILNLLDEDQLGITVGNYERHLGIFTFDGQAKYNVDLGQGSKALANARNVDYLATKWCVVDNNKDLSNISAAVSAACSNADCTALSPGGSCYGIGWPGNVSYAFNNYFQQHGQTADSCDFSGLGLITTVDPSLESCRFTIALQTSFAASSNWGQVVCWKRIVLHVIYVALFFFTCI